MGAERALGLMALALVAVAAYLMGSEGARRLQRRDRMASAVGQQGTGRLERLLRQGVPPLLGAARWMLGFRAVRAMLEPVEGLVVARGIQAAPAPVLSCLLAGLLALVAGAMALTGSPLCAAAVGCCAGIGLVGYARTAEERRQLALREEVPEALRAMNACFRSGLSLMQTLEQTASQIGGQIGGLFEAAAKRLEMGAPASEALAVIERQRGVPELAFAAVALEVQHQSGGSIGPVLEAAQDSVEGELDLLRSLKVQTAQAKLSARVVTVMPFILVALFSLMSPGFLSPFFESLPGMALLAVALVMEAAGVLVVRRMLKVDL